MVTVRYEVPVFQINDLTSPPTQTPEGPLPNHALQSYQMQLMKLEQQNKQRVIMKREEDERRAEEQRNARTPKEQELYDYQLRIKQIDEQFNRGVTMALQIDEIRAQEQKKTCAQVQPEHQSNPTQFEQQDTLPRLEEDVPAQRDQERPYDQAEGMTWAFQEYQMQKMLLEQQNRKRLYMSMPDKDRPILWDDAEVDDLELEAVDRLNKVQDNIKAERDGGRAEQRDKGKEQEPRHYYGTIDD